MVHELSNGTFTDGPSVERVMSVRFLDMAYGPLLCICSNQGTQIYTETATSLLFFHPVTVDPAQSGATMDHHQGACVVTPLQQIAVGTSKGSLVIINATGPDQLYALPESAAGSAALETADVCFSAHANAVVSAHKNGELRIWSLTGPPYTNSAVQQGSEAPVRIVALGSRVIVAYGLGTICLYDAVTLSVQAEITAHARWITALSIREDTAQIASVGEDTVLNVWQIDEASGRVALQYSSVVVDKLLTGVVFNGSGASVVSYDSDEIIHVNF